MSEVAAAAAARAAISLPHEARRTGTDWAPVLADVPLFRNLSRRHIKRVASLARTRRFAAGAPIVRAGDAGSAFFVLLDGAARVVTPKGRAKRLRAGDFFGEMALLDDSPRSADVVADGDVLTMTMAARLRAAESSV